ncbi:MAG: hypothetical protein KA184_19075 [Candidatus Hydrogenedentes bacterium]|nr:hypothetical protein [Candidatus Hydrogenedentota bacterium]
MNRPFLAVVAAAALACCAAARAEGAAPESVAGAAPAVQAPAWPQGAALAQYLEGLAPEGWQAAGPIERYDAASLFEKIDGRSELFHSYEVVGLAFVSLAPASGESRYIDVYLYDMGTVLGAFGVFSVERWPGSPPLRLGRGAYHTDTDVFFWKGRYYACFLGGSENALLRRTALELAGQLAARLPDEPESPWGLAAFPEEGLVPDSPRYFKADALALDFMTDTFTAEYKRGDGAITVFLSRQDSEAAAREKCEKYLEYLQRYGESARILPPEEGGLVVGRIAAGFHDAVFVEGRYLGGVTNVADEAAAVAAAREFHERVRIPE